MDHFVNKFTESDFKASSSYSHYDLDFILFSQSTLADYTTRMCVANIMLIKADDDVNAYLQTYIFQTIDEGKLCTSKNLFTHFMIYAVHLLSTFSRIARII